MPNPSAPAPPCVAGRGTILIVEDETSISFLTKQVLERVGFRILLATDGQQGIDLFTARADEIVAVLLDLSMPKKDGKETLREIKCLRPDVHVLLMSGFDVEELAERFRGEGVSGYMSKPFGPRQLLHKVGEVLGTDLLPRTEEKK